MKKIILHILPIILLSSVPIIAQPQFKALLFTETAGWQHQSISVGVEAIKGLGQKHQFQVDWQGNSGVFNNSERLMSYDVIIFLSTTRNVLNEQEQKNMEAFIRAGKGFVGIHAASDTEYDWVWYTQLVGRMFEHHPANQTTRVTVVDQTFPGLERVPESYLWTDEWYAFGEEKVDGLNYLLTIDESMYEIQPHWDNDKKEGMGEFHPIAWYHEFDGGRSYYNAMGHMPETYSDNMFLDMLYGGIYWAATGKGLK